MKKRISKEDLERVIVSVDNCTKALENLTRAVEASKKPLTTTNNITFDPIIKNNGEIVSWSVASRPLQIGV